MLPFTKKSLTAEEFASLKEVGKGLMQGTIPDVHRKKLISVGYIKEGLGGLMLTDAGKLRLAAGK